MFVFTCKKLKWKLYQSTSHNNASYPAKFDIWCIHTFNLKFLCYRRVEAEGGGKEGEDEGQDGGAHGVEGGGGQLIVVVHVVAVTL